MPDISIVLRALGFGEGRQAVEGFSASARKMGSDTRNAGESARRGMDEASRGAKDLEQNAKNAEGATRSFSDRLNGLRNVGNTLSNAGLSITLMTAQWAQAAKEGEGIEQRLESILRAQERLDELDKQNEIVNDITVRGHYSDDDDIRNAVILLDSFAVKTSQLTTLLEAAGTQARTMGTDIGQVAQQLGTAYNSGQVAMLKRSGVTIDPSEIERINEAYARSTAEGQALFVQIVGDAIRKNSGALEDSLTKDQQAINDAARSADDLQTALGKGVTAGEASLARLNGRLLETINLSPSAAQGLGNFSFWVGTATTQVGGLALALLGIAANVAQIAGTWTGFGTFISGLWTALAARAVVTWGTITGAISTATAATLAFAAANALAIAIVVAGLALVLAGYYLWIKADLDQAAASKKSSDEADKRFYDEQVRRRQQGKSSFVKDGESFQQWRTRMGRGQENSDDDDTSADIPSQAADFMAQAQGLKNGGGMGGVSVPQVSVPTGGLGALPSAAIPNNFGGAGFGPPMADATGVAGRIRESQKRVAQIEAEIDGLERLKEEATTRRKPIIQAQINEAKRRLETARKQLDADKTATDADIEQQGFALNLRRVRLSNDYENNIESLTDARDQARRDGNSARVRSLTYQIEVARAQKERDERLVNAAQTALNNRGRGENDREIAELNYQYALGRAGRTADKEARSIGDSEAYDRRIRALYSLSGGGFISSSPVARSANPAASLRSDYPMDPSGMMPQGQMTAKVSGGQLEVKGFMVPLEDIARALGLLNRNKIRGYGY